MEILQRPAVGVIIHCEYDDRDLKGRKNAVFFFLFKKNRCTVHDGYLRAGPFQGLLLELGTSRAGSVTANGFKPLTAVKKSLRCFIARQSFLPKLLWHVG